MSYAEKLKQFNSTDKYESEFRLLKKFIGMSHNNVLDYGCGNGYAVERLQKYGYNAFGCDVKQYNPDFEYHDVHFSDNFDVVYFMHSLAHIDNVKDVLNWIFFEGKKVIVITPNADWLELNKNDFYKPDESVVKHFKQSELIELFEECGFKIEECGQFGKLTGNQNERLFLIATK